MLNPFSLLELSVHLKMISAQDAPGVAVRFEGAAGVGVGVAVGGGVTDGVGVAVGVGVGVGVGVAVGVGVNVGVGVGLGVQNGSVQVAVFE
jgi:hypothetical protein